MRGTKAICGVVPLETGELRVSPETVSLIKDIVTALAAGTGAVVAVMGLSTWKAQLRGRTEYELARRILRATYRVRDHLQAVRNPVMSAGEISTALEEAGVEREPGPTNPPETDQAVYNRRWNRVTEALSELQVEEREAEVLWGSAFDGVFNDLRECVSDLWYVVWRHIGDVSDRPGVRVDAEERQEIDDVLYRTKKDDDFTKKLKLAVGDVEAQVRPHLKVHRSMLGRFVAKWTGP